MGVLLINTVLLIVMIIVAIVLCVIGVIVGFNLGVAHRKKIAEAEFGSAEEKAKSIVKDAEKAADAKKRELLLEAKEENQKLRADFDAEVKERRNELNRQERDYTAFHFITWKINNRNGGFGNVIGGNFLNSQRNNVLCFLFRVLLCLLLNFFNHHGCLMLCLIFNIF